MARRTCALCPMPAWKLRAKYCLVCDRARRQRLSDIRAEKLRVERQVQRDLVDFDEHVIEARFQRARYAQKIRRQVAA